MEGESSTSKICQLHLLLGVGFFVAGIVLAFIPTCCSCCSCCSSRCCCDIISVAAEDEEAVKFLVPLQQGTIDPSVAVVGSTGCTTGGRLMR